MSNIEPDESRKQRELVYTPAQLETIDSLMRCQAELGLSDRQFCLGYLNIFGESTWNKIKHGVYQVKDSGLARTLADMAICLTAIRRRIARNKKESNGAPYHEFELFEAMFMAVKDCLEKKGEDRLIIYEAPTGGGKSRFFTQLGLREQVTLVRANEAWANSYFFAATDILLSLGVSGKFRSMGDARRAMLERMKGRVSVLAIDEGNYFGPSSINLLKDVLNETEWTVVMGVTPIHLARMKRHYAEWSQLQRRLHTLFRYSGVTKDQAKTFLADAGLNGDTNEAATELARSASQFGGFNFVARVVTRLAEVTRDDEHPTIDDAKAAITFVKAQLDLR